MSEKLKMPSVLTSLLDQFNNDKNVTQFVVTPQHPSGTLYPFEESFFWIPDTRFINRTPSMDVRLLSSVLAAALRMYVCEMAAAEVVRQSKQKPTVTTDLKAARMLFDNAENRLEIGELVRSKKLMQLISDAGDEGLMLTGQVTHMGAYGGPALKASGAAGQVPTPDAAELIYGVQTKHGVFPFMLLSELAVVVTEQVQVGRAGAGARLKAL